MNRKHIINSIIAIDMKIFEKKGVICCFKDL